MLDLSQARLRGNLVPNAMAWGEPGAPVAINSVREAAVASISAHKRGRPIPAGTIDGLSEPMVRGCSEASGDRIAGLGRFPVVILQEPKP